MTTEKQIKYKVTPDIIKKMCELAEGFKDYPKTVSLDTSAHLKNDIVNWCMFPLLIHRAVEGWNKFKETTLDEEILIDSEGVIACFDEEIKHFNSRDYKPENLTACECAMLDCLIEVLNGEEDINYCIGCIKEEMSHMSDICKMCTDGDKYKRY